MLAVVPDTVQAASTTRRAAPSSGCRPAEQFDLQPRHINTAIDFAATPVIGAQLRPTIKRPNTRASLLPAAPS